ncbi:hypothetical protein BCR37DRAFT_382129 [Protomyces lactucae-debilis]|uniref:Uncharacterized protein n=1 Tax=Protomyces lactucae-debilis TaxID=2754530 RepID=A0A1Y2F568_PROLT|nr:uncharacterized protein BCR37DRAFT_382129 [Protomyces lactucae-debilis]ORY78496.1 hypothetical protein BCR37DRAFT_382129 [Protomyces lactucae-debilis]
MGLKLTEQSCTNALTHSMCAPLLGNWTLVAALHKANVKRQSSKSPHSESNLCLTLLIILQSAYKPLVWCVQHIGWATSRSTAIRIGVAACIRVARTLRTGRDAMTERLSWPAHDHVCEEDECACEFEIHDDVVAVLCSAGDFIKKTFNQELLERRLHYVP